MPMVTSRRTRIDASHSRIGATTLALFFVPLFYFLVISLKARLMGTKAGEVGGGASAATAPGAKREDG